MRQKLPMSPVHYFLIKELEQHTPFNSQGRLTSREVRLQIDALKAGSSDLLPAVDMVRRLHKGPDSTQKKQQALDLKGIPLAYHVALLALAQTNLQKALLLAETLRQHHKVKEREQVRTSSVKQDSHVYHDVISGVSVVPIKKISETVTNRVPTALKSILPVDAPAKSPDIKAPAKSKTPPKPSLLSRPSPVMSM